MAQPDKGWPPKGRVAVQPQTTERIEIEPP